MGRFSEVRKLLLCLSLFLCACQTLNDPQWAADLKTNKCRWKLEDTFQKGFLPYPHTFYPPLKLSDANVWLMGPLDGSRGERVIKGYCEVEEEPDHNGCSS